MHFDLIILSNNKHNNTLLNKFNYQIFDNSLFLESDYILNNNISFDYIIVESIDSLKNIDILKDQDYVICNYFLQTSKEHIFYIGKYNNSNKSMEDQINIILEFLY